MDQQEASLRAQQRRVLGSDRAHQEVHLVGMEAHGARLGRTRVDRAQGRAFLVQLPPTRLGLDAWGDSCRGAPLARTGARGPHAGTAGGDPVEARAHQRPAGSGRERGRRAAPHAEQAGHAWGALCGAESAS